MNSILKKRRINNRVITSIHGKFVIIILKIVLAVLLAAVTWNIILTIFIYKNPGTIRDDALGKVYKPGILVNSDEGFSRTQINSFGMRNREIGPKGPNEKRILTLGDSYTEGIQVNDASLYTVKLEKSLRDQDDGNTSVVNAGRSGASPTYYIYLSEFYNFQISPDYTVIQLNDSDWSSDIFNKDQNFYAKEEDDNFQIVFNNYISSSPLLKKFPKLSFMLKFNNLALLNYTNVKLKEINQSNNTVKIKTPTKKADAKDLEKVSDWAIKELKNRYSNIVFLYMPTIDYNNPSKDYTPIEKLISTKCDKYGIDFIDVRSEFINYYLQYNQPVYGFNNTTPGVGHMNEIGHSIVADKLQVYFEGRLKQ